MLLFPLPEFNLPVLVNSSNDNPAGKLYRPPNHSSGLESKGRHMPPVTLPDLSVRKLDSILKVLKDPGRN